MMPKVSVIIPVYNTEKYLSKCFDSVLNQTLKDIEIVAIDDGSKDSSADILEKYAAMYPEKVIVKHKENGGQGIARNIALQLCTGEYIAFLDSDDYYDLTRLEKLYTLAKTNEADFVGCGYTEVMISGETEKITKPLIVNKTCLDNHKMLIGRALVNPLLNFYKRELLLNNRITFTEGYIYEDTAFWAKAVPYIKKPVYLNESLAMHTIHSNSTMTYIKASRVQNIFPVIKDLLLFYRENGLFSDYKNEIEYFCTRILLCSSMERISLVEQRKERRQLILETFDFLAHNIPDYKSNPYLKKGKVEKYIKFATKNMCSGLTELIRLKHRRKDT